MVKTQPILALPPHIRRQSYLEAGVLQGSILRLVPLSDKHLGFGGPTHFTSTMPPWI